MLQTIQQLLRQHALEVFIYLTMAVLLLIAFVKCFLPVLRNTRALNRARRVLRNEHRQKVARPSWNDLHFLGKGLQNEWGAFLQNAELMDLYNDSCDVEDYINADTAVYNVANTPLAELVPGVMVSLGILGTFLGITTGLSGMSSMAESEKVYSAILTLIGGMQTAFLTSICGILASLLFNFLNRIIIGRAENALTRFIEVFQEYGMPKPPTVENKLLAIEQQQSDYLRTFVEDISVRTASEIETAIVRAFTPMQRSMEQFLSASTKHQVEGVDRIVQRFVSHMDKALAGQFAELGQTFSTIAQEQNRIYQDLHQSYTAIGDITRDVTQAHQLSQETIGRFESFVDQVAAAQQQNAQDSRHTMELLEKMQAASQQQARYLAKLQEYQADLQNTMQQYVAWMDEFMTQAQQNNQAAAEAMASSATGIQDSATLLDSSYHGFVEQIQQGLARALSLMDETIAHAAQELSVSATQIENAVANVPEMLSASSRRYSGQVEQFVESLGQLQQSMAALAQSLPEAPKEG